MYCRIAVLVGAEVVGVVALLCGRRLDAGRPEEMSIKASRLPTMMTRMSRFLIVIAVS